MGNLIKSILYLIIFLCHATFANDLNNDADIAWKNGPAYVPGSFFSTTPDKIKLNEKTPVVILMHGCTGITLEEKKWAEFIKDLGFVVIMPNSFARKNRLKNCNPQTKRGGLFPLAQEFRQQEIAHAISVIKSYDWVDTDRIYLMGHSEGGVAAASAPQDDFKGRIITGSSCRTGINGSRSTPILAIVYMQDEWYGKYNASGCSEYSKQFESLIFLGFEGTSHDLYHQDQARHAVKEFLK
jgi:dienelactone hydrolase